MTEQKLSPEDMAKLVEDKYPITKFGDVFLYIFLGIYVFIAVVTIKETWFSWVSLFVSILIVLSMIGTIRKL